MRSAALPVEIVEPVSRGELLWPAGWPAGTGAVMSTRQGGVSAPPFDTLNLRAQSDDPAELIAVAENRRRFAAALGGARRVTSVDLSHTYLDWAGRNFALNDLPLRPHLFVQDDILQWLPLALDVTHASSIAAAAASLQQHFGGLDGLVNNAALLNESHAASVTADEMNRIMAANGTSILHVSQAMLPMLEKSPGAAIVNTLSTQSFFAQPHGTAYGAAKGAAVALTRCMAVDFAPLGIRVNGVAPGFINTRMAIMPDGKHEHETPLFRSFYAEARKIPLGRAGTAEECAGAFVFLLSPLSDYITGQVVTVDGGLTATY